MKIKVKQVKQNRYSTVYFESEGMALDFRQKIDFSVLDQSYNQISDLIKLSCSDKVVDYGCGTGILSYLLSKKYNCQVIGIDYSKDAITLCKKNLKYFKKRVPSRNKIQFINANNDKLPRLSRIKAVFLNDVLEHMYNEEIKILMKEIDKWGKNVKLCVHTDNSIYQKHIDPCVTIVKLILCRTTFDEIKKRRAFIKERHINITNPFKLKKFIARMGYREIIREYPIISDSVITKQLGLPGEIRPIITIVKLVLSIFKFLSPAFFAVYEKMEDKSFN